jgi:hypothetical protein
MQTGDRILSEVASEFGQAFGLALPAPAQTVAHVLGLYMWPDVGVQCDPTVSANHVGVLTYDPRRPFPDQQWQIALGCAAHVLAVRGFDPLAHRELVAYVATGLSGLAWQPEAAGAEHRPHGTAQR